MLDTLISQQTDPTYIYGYVPGYSTLVPISSDHIHTAVSLHSSSKPSTNFHPMETHSKTSLQGLKIS